MAQADDWSWERYRPLLLLQARQLRLDPRLRRRFESSDLVQDALTKAIRKLDQFHGQSEGERVKWLQAILHNHVMEKIDAETAGRRDVRKEQPIADAFADSSARWDKVLGVDVGRPDREAERREFLVRLAKAMGCLSEDQRDAVLLVHVLRLKLCEAAQQMCRTEKSVAGLVRRGLEELRTLLPEYKPPNL
jgi:RNA polymerase sigma-70 factor, ECF subfamily